MKLWAGRFQKETDTLVNDFNSSIGFDARLYKQDIQGSMAHAAMLGRQGIIEEHEAEKIINGLKTILSEIEGDGVEFSLDNEDIHMNIEAMLTERIGDAGARLHTGRSRNDQVITDTRLYAKELCRELMGANLKLRKTLLALAAQNEEVLLPGYTHLQHAQPVLLAHHFMAYYWMFTRDFNRLRQAFDAADMNPLGSAALAGTTYPLDRDATTRALGFAAPIPNSLDAVSDRDFLLDLDYAASVSMIHLSRLAEEIILWSTSEFGFITLSDAFSTGSSIMPQKKNPDFAELIRGKSGRVVGDLVALLVTMKSLPLAYNKDLQEDKEGVIDAAKTLYDCLTCMEGMIATMKINKDAMRIQAEKGYLAATDVADYLAKKGTPFRQAHEVVGHLVLLCDKRGCNLDDLSLEDFKAESELFEEDITGALDLESIVAARTTFGGTSREALHDQMQLAEDSYTQDNDYFFQKQPA